MKICHDYDPFYDPFYQDVKRITLIEGLKLGYKDGFKDGQAKMKELLVFSLLKTGEMSMSKLQN